MLVTTKPSKATCQVRLAEWAKDETAIAHIRHRVFIEEQGVPEDLEWEDEDDRCVWFMAVAGEDCVGVARLTPAGKLGRMAVLPEWRSQGVGTSLMNEALVEAKRRGLHRVILHAQTQAIPFYSRFGFRAVGVIFDEAGIPHREMRLKLEMNA